MKLTVRAVHINPLEPHTFTRPQPRGRLTTDATEPEWNGYLLTVACACGVVFGRWVTSDEAELDLFGETKQN